ncbi:MAG: metalloregulator ArsR/SmtB family transcription factor [Alphaproteobacteria bacterium]|jgi:DNA-binding transcriptional ArsR family regulator|nr:metalloregulator ArsR/SmtB family transcription factor [Alphaproteobacteria bacterium]MDP6517711.1 metalloregulator ArsR/SmtB family transcription factor [Alphaproteobacteria bacterium]
MVKYHADPLSATLSALSDPTRRALVARLSRGACNVGELAKPFDISLPAISKHLSVLEDAGLVRREKLGRARRCRLEPEPLKAAAAWLLRHQGFWEASLDSLAHFLDHGHDPGGRGA